MQLIPKDPPGRVSRKARAYFLEIHRLREAGYTVAAIRQALLDVGIEVSTSTVWRESVRSPPSSRSDRSEPSAAHSVSTDGAQTPASTRPSASADSPAGLPQTFVNDARTGKQIVDEFMKGRTTNPLLQERT